MSQVSESYGDNMSALALMSYWIIETTPPIGPRKKLTLRNPFNKQIIKKLVDDYGEKFGILAMYVNKHVPIYIYNRINENAPPAYYQYYKDHTKSGADAIHLYFPMAINIDTTDQTVNLSTQLNKFQTTELMTFFAHELRHVMQRNEFGEYFSKLSNAYSEYSDPMEYYDHNHLEIDASMHHIALSVVEDSNFTNDIHDFVNEVMRRLSSYKKLSSKEYKHYRRKAANIFAYYVNNGKIKQTKNTQGYHANKELEMRRNRLANVIISYINNDWNFIRDLRKYGMSKLLFWKRKSYLLHKNFPLVIEKMFQKPRGEVEKDAEVYVIFFALLNLAAKQRGYILPIKNLYELYGLYPMKYGEAMKNPKSRKIFGSYDKKFISYALSELPKEEGPQK